MSLEVNPLPPKAPAEGLNHMLTTPGTETDHAPTAGSSTSNIATFDPYTPSQDVDTSTQGNKSPKDSRKKKKGKKAVRVQDNRSIQTAPGIFEPNDYKKYLNVVLDDSNADIFDVHRDLINCCGKEPKVYAQGTGRILVEASTPEESRRLQGLTQLGGVQATCNPHPAMNQSKGIIYAPQLSRYPEEKLLKEFEPQGVIEVRRLRKIINGAITPLPQLVLTFDRLRLPEYITAAWYKYKIRLFVPRPKRCFYCQEFGHVLDSCRRKTARRVMVTV